MEDDEPALRWHDESDVDDWLAACAEAVHERAMPSPSEIETESAAIRDSWTQHEKRKRAAGLAPAKVEAVELDREAIREHVRSCGGWGEES